MNSSFKSEWSGLFSRNHPSISTYDTRPILVADGWAEAEMCVFILFDLCSRMDRRTNGWTKALIELCLQLKTQLMISWVLMRAQAWNTPNLRTKRDRDFFLGNRHDLFYPNFESWYLMNGLTDWLDFCYGNIISPFYCCEKFQEISDKATTQTSLPTQKFQIFAVRKIFYEIFWNFACTTISPLDKSWVSCTAIR